jgi:Zn-dependent hydrolases, including glyoxylases
MELTKINGNTYYINAPTNIGVYTYKNKNCLLVDTGINNTAARKIENVLTQNKLHTKYIINTHSHVDHCGGNNFFRENYTGCIVYTSAKEKLYMENAELRPNMLYTSTPDKELEDEFRGTPVDFILDPGLTKINDDKFEILSLKGHSPDGIGIITSDRVCFLGDAIFSNTILDKYSFPYLFNIDETLKTLEKIKEIDADYFVISHADSVINKEEIAVLADRNIANINKYLDEMLELLDEPHSKEDLLENIIILNNLFISFRQYHLNFSSMSAFLAYLCNKGEVKHSVENGNVYYYKG